MLQSVESIKVLWGEVFRKLTHTFFCDTHHAVLVKYMGFPIRRTYWDGLQVWLWF